MSDIKLFKLVGTGVASLPSSSVALEKSLQTLMEQNLEALMGIRFLETEYWTGLKHNGRIDTLGVDENGCPVIIEYKRSMNQNVPATKPTNELWRATRCHTARPLMRLKTSTTKPAISATAI